MARSYLAIETILTILQGTTPRLEEMSAGFSPQQLRASPGEGEWSANEILAHLRACDDVWGGRYIQTILAEDNPTIKAINPRTWIKQTDYLDQEFRPSVRAFARQRAGLVAALRNLPPEGWTRTCRLVGAGKPLTQTLIAHADGLARHERAHLKQIERTLAALK